MDRLLETVSKYVQRGLLLGLERPRGAMRVQITRQQSRLEKQQARAPHRGRSAEPRQDNFADHRLHREQQKRA